MAGGAQQLVVGHGGRGRDELGVGAGRLQGGVVHGHLQGLDGAARGLRGQVDGGGDVGTQGAQHGPAVDQGRNVGHGHGGRGRAGQSDGGQQAGGGEAEKGHVRRSLHWILLQDAGLNLRSLPHPKLLSIALGYGVIKEKARTEWVRACLLRGLTKVLTFSCATCL